MKTAIAPLALTLLLATSSSFAQKTPRGIVRRKPPTAVNPQPTSTTAQPTPTPNPTPSRPPAAPVPLVTLNGQTLTTASLDPELRAQLDGVEDKIADAKRNILDLQINTLLLEVEAQRRHISSHQLYELEVVKKIQMPTPVQVKQFLSDNKAQFDGVDEATANSQAVALIHDEFETRLSDALVARLQSRYRW